MNLGVLHAANVHGFTLLLNAAMYGFSDIVALLLDARAGVNVADCEGRTALHWAMIHDHAEVVRLLLKRGANPRLRDVRGDTPLASSRAHQETKVMLVELVQLNERMVEAARCLQVVEVTRLLSRGVCVDCVDEQGWTAMMWGALCGSLDMVGLLITRGASVHIRNEAGQTVADLAKTDGMNELLHANNDLLAAAGRVDVNLNDIKRLSTVACIDTQDDALMTSLMWASYHGRADVVRYLVEARRPALTKQIA